MSKSTLPTAVVPCPFCRAEKGECCRLKNGGHTNVSHVARRKAYQAAIKLGAKSGDNS